MGFVQRFYCTGFYFDPSLVSEVAKYWETELGKRFPGKVHRTVIKHRTGLGWEMALSKAWVWTIHFPVESTHAIVDELVAVQLNDHFTEEEEHILATIASSFTVASS